MRKTSTMLYNSEGSSGNNSPTIMGKVEVTKDEDDIYQFKIMIE
jgi:hypothetical protein